MFLKIGVLKNFANLTEKYQAFKPGTLLKETSTQLVSCEICEFFFKTLFFSERFYSDCFCVFWKFGENFSLEQFTNPGRCSQCIKKIPENETMGEISSGLKTCNALIVFSKKIAVFSKVFLMSIRSTEQLFLERPLHSFLA